MSAPGSLLNPQPCSECGVTVPGLEKHALGCPNNPSYSAMTQSQHAMRSRKKAIENGFTRVEVLLSPAMMKKLERLAQLHGSKRKAIEAAIAAL